MKLPIILLLTWLTLNGQMSLKHTSNIEQSFATPKAVDIDNILGGIHVIGTDGNTVELSAVRTDEADTQADLDRAAKEITLKTEVRDGELEIYPDGPFRNDHSPFHGNDWHSHYRFTFELTVKVPRSMNLNLREVKGKIAVENVNGHFSVHGVNGGIELTGISGGGEFRSVNGPVHVGFAQNPTEPSSFRTVNGGVTVELRPGMNADLEFKTLHGGVFTDFDVSAGTPVPGTADQASGKFVFRSHGFSTARIGSGGPKLTFETVNGEVRILKK
jgi:hypothetical protein